MKRILWISLVCLVNFLVAYDITKHASWHLLDHENCGESLADRIIGGTAAALGEFPWMVRIGYQKPYPFYTKPPVYKCGGSLINNLYVLTAAHCVTELNGENIVVIRLGENNAKTAVDCEGEVCAPQPQDFKPVEVIPHEMYQNPAMRNDIALIRLDHPARIDSFVAPICLPHGPLMTKDHVGSIMEVAGWGVSEMKRRRISNILLHVRVPVVQQHFCDTTLGQFASIGPGQLCAGGQIGFDSCGGDSGGPLMKPEAIDGPPKYYLIGVVSFGSVKCGGDAPAVYTDVAKYVKWILDHIEP